MEHWTENPKTRVALKNMGTDGNFI
jgi:hypothetical protein